MSGLPAPLPHSLQKIVEIQLNLVRAGFTEIFLV